MEEHGGCVCKGSLKVHSKCFSKMCQSSPNPFSCSICKSELSAVFLEKFIGIEKIMMHKKEYNEGDDEDGVDVEEIGYNSEWYELNGILIEKIDGELYFQSEKEMYLYLEYQKRYFLSQKYSSTKYQHSQKIVRHQKSLQPRHSFKKSKVRVRF